MRAQRELEETPTPELPSAGVAAVAPARRRRPRAGTWLSVAAILLALWAATCFVDLGDFVVSGLAALAPLVTLLALPVIAIAVGRRHPIPAVIALAAALTPWALVPGYAASGPSGAVIRNGSSLRVMSVDGAGGGANAQQIVTLARNYAVDVVVVTDLTTELSHRLTVAGLNGLLTARWVQAPPGRTDGAGLWSRLTVNDLQPIAGLSRPGVGGSIVAGSDQVGITVAQLAGKPLLPGGSWDSDLAELRRTPKTERQFIVGDLNATPWQPAFRRLTDSGWRDAADIVGQGLRPTWPSWSPLPISPLDHVLVHGGLAVSGADTVNVAGTDHRALIVTLVLPHDGG